MYYFCQKKVDWLDHRHRVNKLKWLGCSWRGLFGKLLLVSKKTSFTQLIRMVDWRNLIYRVLFFYLFVCFKIQVPKSHVSTQTFILQLAFNHFCINCLKIQRKKIYSLSYTILRLIFHVNLWVKDAYYVLFQESSPNSKVFFSNFGT